VQAKLIESWEIAPSVRNFVFEALGGTPFVFRPGQWVSLTALLEGREITRAYSIASAPSRGNRFELCLNRVDHGVFSPHLFDLHPGDVVEMREPMGDFVLREPLREAVFIATGTGVAPFRAMLQACLTPDSSPVTLLLGVRYERDMLYRAEFEDMARRNGQFQFIPTLTQPDANWSGRTGRVQAHLAEILGSRRDLDVYLCGMRAMVDDVRRILKEMGFDRRQIRYERYD